MSKFLDGMDTKKTERLSYLRTLCNVPINMTVSCLAENGDPSLPERKRHPLHLCRGPEGHHPLPLGPGHRGVAGLEAPSQQSVLQVLKSNKQK